jgi:hypothetical protein
MGKLTKRRIKVNDYRTPYTLPNKGIEVDAWCVSGNDGVFAFFFHGKSLYMAGGDDGHWWVVDHMDKAWTREFKKTVAEIDIPRR